MNRVRDFFEKLLYTGMKPGAPTAPTVSPKGDAMRWLGPLRGPVDRFLSGGGSSDPLYLTNRSTKQKILTWFAIGVPFAAVVTVLFLAASGTFSTPPPQPKPESASAVAAVVLPDFKDVQMKINRDVLVLDAFVDFRAKPITLSGRAKNVSNRTIRVAEIIFELTDNKGSQVGGQSVTVENLGPQETTRFSVTVPVPAATFALVREVNTR